MAGQRFFREEGFSLPEMTVTILMMLVVLFALYSIFDMSIRVFSFGNDKVEVAENARVGLEKLEREIRAAYPLDKAGGDGKIFYEWSSTRVSFGNDLDGNNKIECVEGSPCERITYDVYKPSGGTTYALGRATSGDRKPVVEFVDYTNTNNTGLSFGFFESDGTKEIVPGSGNERDVAVVRLEIRVKKDNVQDASQTLTTVVSLRNRGNGVAPPAASHGAGLLRYGGR